jgi:hypothetical protein
MSRSETPCQQIIPGSQLLSVAYAEYLRFGDEEPGWIDYVAEQPGGNVKILAYRLDLDPWSRTGHAR